MSTALATMPAIASTGAMLFTGHKGTSGKSALARRTESSTRLANIAVQRQVSGTSDCAQGAINCSPETNSRLHRYCDLEAEFARLLLE
jgi:hypothetical protein